MPSPFVPLRLLLFIFLLALLLVFVQVGLLTIAFEKLGLSQGSAFLLLSTSLLGSWINLPLFRMRSTAPPAPPQMPHRFWGLPQVPFTGITTVALNVGGGLIPVVFSLYLFVHHSLHPGQVALAVLAVSTVSYLVSRPVQGLGIGMPIFVAPVSAALSAILINAQQGAPLAYIGGTLGVLIGADILRIRDIRGMGTPMAAIGGAGTFDGIFITGIVAALLA